MKRPQRTVAAALAAAITTGAATAAVTATTDPGAIDTRDCAATGPASPSIVVETRSGDVRTTAVDSIDTATNFSFTIVIR